MVRLDEVDKEILRILKLEGRASVREISRRLNVSPSTVSRKINKMEAEGTIKGYISIIEDEELGQGSRAVLLVRTSGDYDQGHVVEKIETMEDICNVFTTMGNYDLILTACTRNDSSLYEMINRIRKLEGILWVDFASIVTRKKVMSMILPDTQ